MDYIRTLLVDDNPKFLDAASRFLISDPIIDVIATSLSGEEAIEQVRALNPDLVLMDIALPGISGLEATRRIKGLPDPPCVIILTLHDNEEYRNASQAVQADDFIAKSDFGNDLLSKIYQMFEEITAVASQ